MKKMETIFLKTYSPERNHSERAPETKITRKKKNRKKCSSFIRVPN